MITRLNYLALKAPDPRAAAEFAAEKMGFELVHADDDGTSYLKAHGVDPYNLLYTPGEAPGLDHLSYLVQDEAALDAAAARLESHGVAVARIDSPGWDGRPAIRFTTPAGHLLQLTTGVHTPVPVAHMVSLNGASAGSAAPVTADHVGLAVTDFDAEMNFAIDVLGLLPSNRVLAPGDLQVMSFLRAPKRFLYHCLVVVRGEETGVHHYQMSLKSVDSFYATYDALKAKGVDVQWGPLRHGPGHNIAMYFQDGAGYWVEYSVEEEIILDDEHYEPRTWTVADPHVVDEWQSGAPPLGLMGPPPMEPDTPEQAEIRRQVFARVGQMVNKRLYVGLSKVNMTSPPPPIDVVGEHLKYALKLEAEGVLFAAGPFVDDEGKMIGDGLFIIRADSKAQATEILAKDPIHLGNFRTCTVYGWTLHEGKLNVSFNLSDQTYTLG
ncbi:MAG TPA: VOC family protein [Solirubrobacteraceae bacterium]|nr:VOC family protein [Solirubrobacteraceae bacterium]